jgi:hypothetical protein
MEEGRLILLDREEIITAALHDRGTDVTLREQSISGDHTILQRQLPQEELGHRQFLALVVGGQLAKDNVQRWNVGGEQMQTCSRVALLLFTPSGSATYRLAINGDLIIGRCGRLGEMQRRHRLTKPRLYDVLKRAETEVTGAAE